MEVSKDFPNFPDFPFSCEKCFEEEKRLKKSDVEELRSWVNKLGSDSYIPRNISDKMLILFLTACYFKVENTKKCMLVCYEIRFKDPLLFDSRNVDSEEMKKAAQVQEFCLLPERTDEGYDIIFNRLKDFEPKNLNRDTSQRYYLMTMDRISYERGPSKGVVLLFDCTGSRFGHMFTATLAQVKSHMTYVQEGLPIKAKTIIVLNTNSVFNTIMSVLKPLMSGELFRSLHLFSSNTNMEEFYKTVLPRKCLPKDYGGLLPTVAELHSENTDALRKMQTYFEEEEANRKYWWNNNNK